MKQFLKQVFCKHVWMWTVLTADEIVYICFKCGKEKSEKR